MSRTSQRSIFNVAPPSGRLAGVPLADGAAGTAINTTAEAVREAQPGILRLLALARRRQGLAQDDRGLQRHLRRLRLSLSIGRLERPVDEKDAPPPVWAYRRFPHRSQPPSASSFDPPPTPIRRILLPRASCPVLPALR